MGLGRAKWRAQIAETRVGGARSRADPIGNRAGGRDTHLGSHLVRLLRWNCGTCGGKCRRGRDGRTGWRRRTRGLRIASKRASFTGATWQWRAFGFGVASLTQEQTAESALASHEPWKCSTRARNSRPARSWLSRGCRDGAFRATSTVSPPLFRRAALSARANEDDRVDAMSSVTNTISGGALASAAASARVGRKGSRAARAVEHRPRGAKGAARDAASEGDDADAAQPVSQTRKRSPKPLPSSFGEGKVTGKKTLPFQDPFETNTSIHPRRGIGERPRRRFRRARRRARRPRETQRALGRHRRVALRRARARQAGEPVRSRRA